MIVVTGGAGFIGSCIVARLNSIGLHDIIVVDHLTDSKKENLKNKRYRQYYDKRDFLEMIIKDKIDPKIDCMIHMGACSSTTLNDAKYFQENNYEYSCHMAQWSLKHKARFIYASSAATYGDGALGYKDDEAALKKLKPLNFYGASKHKFDQWVFEHFLTDQVVGLKFFNVFGPNEYHKMDMRSVIAKSYEKVIKEGKISLFKSYRKEYADGEQKRDFIYVKDAVNVVMYFYKNPRINGIYNVGSGIARTWNDLALALFKATHIPPKIEYFDMSEDLKSKYQYFTQADILKLKKSGYNKPFTTLEDAVKDYVSYLKNHAYL